MQIIISPLALLSSTAQLCVTLCLNMQGAGQGGVTHDCATVMYKERIDPITICIPHP